MMADPLEALGQFGIVPVVKIDDVEDAVGLGRALVAGGLPCAEITFRTAAAEGAIRRISLSLPEIILGAGTVLSVEQAQKAVHAGARFIVSPGFDRDIVEWCLDNDVAVTPGVVTPTEINYALAYDLHIVKFFPSEAMGGIATLKAIGAPYGDVKFIPTGGISQHNLASYLAQPMVHCCGGSWLVSGSLISAAKFDTITQLAAEAVSIVQSVRQPK
jgi:2-dehydro-3-deoxyphosphogluconate aldolase/(4S)-4-hydroxy-2-oxoglutarate aldolase